MTNTIDMIEEEACPECNSIYCTGPDPEDDTGLCGNGKRGMAEADVREFCRRNRETAEYLMSLFEGE